MANNDQSIEGGAFHFEEGRDERFDPPKLEKADPNRPPGEPTDISIS
jgi:hypothetical protein